MSNQLKPLVISIILLGALLYIGGIIWAGVVSLSATRENPASLPPFVDQVIIAIGTALAAHFGALFGISRFMGGAPQPAPKAYQVYAWAMLPARKTGGGTVGSNVQASSRGSNGRRLDFFQISAAYLYLISLILALVFWAITGFSEYAADALRNMSFALLGVIGGVLAVVLNVRR